MTIHVQIHDLRLGSPLFSTLKQHFQVPLPKSERNYQTSATLLLKTVKLRQTVDILGYPIIGPRAFQESLGTTGSH